MGRGLFYCIMHTKVHMKFKKGANQGTSNLFAEVFDSRQQLYYIKAGNQGKCYSNPLGYRLF